MEYQAITVQARTDQKGSKSNHSRHVSATRKVMGRITTRVAPRMDCELADGSYPLYLTVYLSGKRFREKLKINVTPKQWDATKEMVKHHPRATDYNILIQEWKGRVNKVISEYHFTGKALTIDLLRQSVTDPYRQVNFVTWYMDQLENRRGLIEDSTYRQHKTTYNKLLAFRPVITFSDISYELLTDFEKYVKFSGQKSALSVFTHMKNLRTYVNKAIDSGIRIENPFKKYRMPKVRGSLVSLTFKERDDLTQLYRSGQLNDHLQKVLRAFLFSCWTGLRFSDLVRLRRSMIFEDSLRFKPFKTRRFQKWVYIPIGMKARQYVSSTAIDLIFEELPVQQVYNRHLKEIARLAGIDKKVTSHVGRHTFATLFILSDGDVTVLQRLLGHSSIEQTMIYVHMNNTRIQRQMERFEAYRHEAA